jgi:flagellar basal body-associated protein FliL
MKLKLTILLIFTVLMTPLVLYKFHLIDLNLIKNDAPQAESKDDLVSKTESKISQNEAKLELLKFLDKNNGNLSFVELEPLFVNLPADGKRGGERSVEVEIIVQVKNRSLEVDFEKNKHLVRDKITSTLSLRDPKQLLDLSSRDTVCSEIALVLNSIFEPELTQAFLTFRKDDLSHMKNIVRLQNAGVLPKDISSNITPEMIQLSKGLTTSSLPIQQVLFKKIKIN